MTEQGQGSACCGSQIGPQVPQSHEPWMIGEINTAGGTVAVAATRLTVRDRLGSFGARWGVNRMNYTVGPGLYAVGSPDETMPVFVTANYKMSFDHLRRSLDGMNAWILVLDTFGINVWCAAGKGTFGTEELVRRIQLTGLAEVVSHRSIIVPQLGAPGVAAHLVKARTGFRVVYGPVRAADIPAYMANKMKASPEMRRVHFGVLDRLVLVPIELTASLKPILIIGIALVLLRLAGVQGITWGAVLTYLGAFLAGAAVTPILLPWIPGRPFALKGWLVGLGWAIMALYLRGLLPDGNVFETLPALLIVPAISAYLAMNFTGASTYTSPSGVKKEMRYALPVIGASGAAGLILIVVWIVASGGM
ncbi:MAG: mercury methylation corrinoid protein HgcA [Solirubrobacterales bacterium]